MKRRFTKLIAALALLLLIAPPLVGWGQSRTEGVYKTALFGSSNNSQGTNNYTTDWYSTTEGFRVDLTKFNNNNNGWNGQVKTGNKTTATVGTIQTHSVIDQAITKVDVTITAITAAKVNSIKLYTSSDNSSWTEAGTYDKSSGVKSVSLTTPTANLYYKIAFDCDNGGSSNGFVTISKVEYYYNASAPTPTITISPDNISKDHLYYYSTGYDEDAWSMATTNISSHNAEDFTVVYSDTEDGTYTENNPAMLTVYPVYTNNTFKLGYNIFQNESYSPRECYFKVMYGTTESNVVHVTQSAAPAPTYTVTLSGNAINADYQGTVSGDAITVSTNLTENLGYEVYYNDNGNYTSTNPYDWFDADVNSSNQIESIFGSNPTYSERIAQIKVYTTDGTNEAWSEVITVTQAAAPAPYINIVANHGETVENPYLIERPTWQNGGGLLREVEFGNFTVSGASDFQILYCNANGEPIDETPAMFSGVQVDYYYYQYYQTYVYRLYVAVTNNNSTQDRSGYFKVWANNNNNPVYSGLVTVHQPGKPQVATPTFNPAAGAVPAGTEVAISCTTEGAAIQYSTDGTNYSEYTAPIVINEAMTLYAIATKQNHVDSEVATAQYTVKGDAVFENGVYYESMESQQSFDNMQVVNVVGEEQTWEFNLSTEAAYMNGYNSGYVANTDWLITPKMAVENGKLNVSFGVKKSYASNQLSWKWSTSNDINGDWNTLTFTEPSSGWGYPESDIETDAEYVYVAFVYDNTSATSAAAYYVYGFEARQYYNVTFDANGGEGTMATQNLAAGDVTLPGCTYTYEGKSFRCWNTAANGSGTDYEAGATYPLIGEATLYAQWEDAYKVKFMTNGVEDVTVEVVQGQAIGTLPTANAAYIPSGYVFKGWLDSEYQVSDVAPNEYINSAYEPEGDVTLYAVFAIPGETSYTLVGPSDVTEGTYIIGALKSTEATNNFYFATSTISSGAINVNASSTAIPETSGVRSIASLPSGAVEFTFTGNSTNGFTISTIISASTKYLGYTSYANNKLSFNTDYSTFTWKAVEKTNALVTNGVYLDNYTTNGHYYISENTTNDNCIRAYTNSSNIYRAIYLFKKAETSSTNYRTSLTENHTLSISGYADFTGINNTGYHFIASPVYVDPATVEGMTEGDYDLYYFDEAQDHEEWRNYEAGNFTFVPGTGYLYAKKATAATPTYNFTLEGAPYNGNGQVTLQKAEGTQFSGWNLIGNPYANPATLGTTAFYKMNSTGSELESVDVGTTIDAMEGVFVLAANDGDVVTFEEQTPNEPNSGNAVSQLSININKSRGESIDRAIVRFDNGNQLPKFQLNPKHTKVYFQQDNKDYAVVRSAAQGEMPISFKAETRGTYTLSVNAENVEMSYLHLIDNMTGADVDLLQTPSYTFEAKTSDYASRFRLMFSANSISEDADGDNAFAYFNGSNWTISNMGEATLQVVDVMGRVLSSETLSGNAEVNINQPTGVYMLRLLNENNVRVQKIVVR